MILFRLTFMKGYTSGRDTNNNFNQHCQKHALITRHGKFRPFDTSSSRVDNLTLHKFIPSFLLHRLSTRISQLVSRFRKISRLGEREYEERELLLPSRSAQH